MCRSENSSVSMYDPGQQFYRHPPHFQNTRLYTFRQNYQKMSCIVCIILNSLQHYEVRILFSFDVISPVSVTIIRIMVRYQHSLITFFLQNANIFFNFDFSTKDPSFVWQCISNFTRNSFLKRSLYCKTTFTERWFFSFFPVCDVHDVPSVHLLLFFCDFFSLSYLFPFLL